MIVEIPDDKIMQIARKGHAAMAMEERTHYSVEQVREAFVSSFPILLDSSLSVSDNEISEAPEHRTLPFNEALGLPGIGLPIISLWEGQTGSIPRLSFPAPSFGPPPARRVTYQQPTLDEFLEESIRESEMTEAARKAHAVMEDAGSYTAVEVEMALLAYLPSLLSGLLSDIESWTQGAVEERPRSFNDHLEAARAYVLGALYGAEVYGKAEGG